MLVNPSLRGLFWSLWRACCYRSRHGWRSGVARRTSWSRRPCASDLGYGQVISVMKSILRSTRVGVVWALLAETGSEGAGCSVTACHAVAAKDQCLGTVTGFHGSGWSMLVALTCTCDSTRLRLLPLYGALAPARSSRAISRCLITRHSTGKLIFPKSAPRWFWWVWSDSPLDGVFGSPVSSLLVEMTSPAESEWQEWRV